MEQLCKGYLIIPLSPPQSLLSAILNYKKQPLCTSNINHSFLWILMHIWYKAHHVHNPWKHSLAYSPSIFNNSSINKNSSTLSSLLLSESLGDEGSSNLWFKLWSSPYLFVANTIGFPWDLSVFGYSKSFDWFDSLGFILLK